MIGTGPFGKSPDRPTVPRSLSELRCALDRIIANGEVVDGTGRPRFRADVGLLGNRIEAVAARIEAPDVPRLDATGRVVTPGFIDLHSHSDLSFTLPLLRQSELLGGRVRQGITTELVGNCGIGCAPLVPGTLEELRRLCGFIAPDGVEWDWDTVASYLERIERQGVLVNVGTLVAHGPVRALAMGPSARRPSEEEMRRLGGAVRDAVEAGAFGISFGLIYPPGQFADTAEITLAAAAARDAGGFAAFHQRGSSRDTLHEAVREILQVGRDAVTSVHHSHVETVGPRAWGSTVEILRLHDGAARDGVDLSGDVIPYTAVCTTMLALYPPWSLDGGVDAFLERLRDPAIRRRMREEMAEAVPLWPPWEGEGRWTMNIARECGWERIRLAHVDGAAHRGWLHLSLAEIGRRAGRDPFEALSDLMIAERGVATQLIFGISGDAETDSDLVPLLQSPRLAFVTDAWEIGKGWPHPGAYGAFPRVLSVYVRERRLLTFEEAVRKMTSLPASRMGLKDRGIVAPGMKADLLVLDPETVADGATYDRPRIPATGIDDVFINGRQIVDAGIFRPQSAGQVLRRAA